MSTDNNKVEFENEDFGHSNSPALSRTQAKGLAQLLINLKLARTPQQAHYILLGILVVALIANIVVITKFFSPVRSGNERQIPPDFRAHGQVGKPLQ